MDTGIPLYFRIANHLRNKVMAGVYQPGEKIPSESMLCEEFNTSRITIRQALKILEDQDMILRKQGVGTLVNKKVSLQPVNFNGYIEDIIFQLLPAKVICFHKSEVRPEQDIREILKLPDEQKSVIKLERIRAIGNKLTIYAENYIPAFLGHDFEEQHLEDNSLTHLLGQRGAVITEAYQTIQARAASRRVAEKLEINIGDPVLFSEYLMKDDNNRFVNLARVYYHADRYKYTVNMVRINDTLIE
jgi:DNA-binding GntR family transcriptional regulator